MCSAIKGTGRKKDSRIKEGLQWLCDMIDLDFARLNTRVREDLRVQDIERKKDLEERKARVQKLREQRYILTGQSISEKSLIDHFVISEEILNREDPPVFRTQFRPCSGWNSSKSKQKQRVGAIWRSIKHTLEHCKKNKTVKLW